MHKYRWALKGFLLPLLPLWKGHLLYARFLIKNPFLLSLICSVPNFIRSLRFHFLLLQWPRYCEKMLNTFTAREKCLHHLLYGASTYVYTSILYPLCERENTFASALFIFFHLVISCCCYWCFSSMTKWNVLIWCIEFCSKKKDRDPWMPLVTLTLL